MGILIPNEIKLDFYNPKYVAVNAKQYDSNSRNILVSCCNRGKFYKLNKNYHVVYIRLKRPDGKGIIRHCDITNDGKISIVLNNAMMDVRGKCDVDLLIFDKTYSSTNSTYGGVFVANAKDDGDGNVELTYLPNPVIEDSGDGNISITGLSNDNGTVTLNGDLSPFIVADEKGNVTMASISSTGEMNIPNVNIVTTMTFYINVLPSVFHEGITII